MHVENPLGQSPSSFSGAEGDRGHGRSHPQGKSMCAAATRPAIRLIHRRIVVGFVSVQHWWQFNRFGINDVHETGIMISNPQPDLLIKTNVTSKRKIVRWTPQQFWEGGGLSNMRVLPIKMRRRLGRAASSDIKWIEWNQAIMRGGGKKQKLKLIHELECHITQPGRLVKFTTGLVAPQIVATLTLVATNFQFPRFFVAYCLPYAQYSKNSRLMDWRVVSLMSDCVW